MYGYLGLQGEPNYDVKVLTISNGTSVSTTSQIFDIGLNATSLAISPDGRFAYVCLDSTIKTLGINSNIGVVTTTNIMTYGPSSTAQDLWDIKIVPEGNLAVVKYIDISAPTWWLATAWVNGDGTLTWTGYRFPYDSIYGGGFNVLSDFDILPIYTTGIPPELWKDSLPDTEVHSAQKVMGDGD